MAYAKAPYILFADQDDQWLPNKIELSLNLLQTMEQRYGSTVPLLVHTDLKVVGKDLSEIAPSFWRYANLNPHLTRLNRLLVQNNLTGCTMLMNRTLLKLAYPIPDAAVMHDWWIALVVSCFGHIQPLNQPTLLYRQHGLNDTGAKPYGLWRFFQQSAQETTKKAVCTSRTYDQAHLLLERYEALLNEQQKTLLEAYAQLPTLSFLQQKRKIIKHRFFKQGFLRNLKLLIGKF